MKKRFYLAPAILFLGACSIANNSSISSSDLSSTETSISTSSTESSTSSTESQSSSSSGTSENISSSSSETSNSSSGEPISSSQSASTSTSESSSTSSDPNAITDLSLANISYADNTYTIRGAGTFAFSGSLEGNIYIDAGDEDEVEIDLNNFTISSSSNSPIFCNNASSLKIKLQKGSKNYVYDNRSAKSEDDDAQGNGAIYSKCDSKITGKGSLVVKASYNNGIHSTKDLTLKSTVDDSSSIQVTALNNALKGNDSISIESGNIVAISTGGDGLKTDDTDTSSKGNQRGNITISGGQVDIYSCCDGIDASYNAYIQNGTDDSGNTSVPVVNIYTSNYSSYSGEVAETSDSILYLRSNENLSSASTCYVVLFKNQDGTTTWKKASYLTSKSANSGGGGFFGGGRGGPSSSASYYYYQVEKPSTAISLKVYKFSSSTTDYNESDAVASTSSYQSINSNLDTFAFNVSSSSITSSGWTSYSTTNNPNGNMGGRGGMDQGNTAKSEYSAKGIKADNTIQIDGGVISIKSYDDALHANYGTSFDNDEKGTGLGDVLINGGELSLTAADDGIHADRYLTINGGNIDVVTSYEGLEGNYISVKGGYSKVYATDDGVNAANKAGLNPVVDISGGILDVTVYGGDVDAIDSNGSFKQSGGFVVSKGANSNMSTGLDVDSTAAISGGTFVCFGNPEKTPSLSSGVSKKSLSGSYAIGTYQIVNGDTTITTTTKYSYNVINVYSSSVGSVSITKQ